MPRQTLTPVVAGSDLLPGSWSPDGRYFTFSRSTSLQYLDVTRSQVCSWDGETSLADLWSSTVWLPDGELRSSDRRVICSCKVLAGAAYPLFGGDAARFREIIAADPSSGNVLLKANEGFWILDGAAVALKYVGSVTPNPYELHWDQAAWLPGGRRLAISRLNGRESSAGSTLYILDGQTGDAQLSLARAYADDQRAPGVEWLSQNELLLYGGGALSIVDLSANPPQETNVIQDLFGLDLAYPDEISAMASVVDRKGGGYYLAVRANHPRNQSLYLYTSATGQVQVFEPQYHSLLFFPDGQMIEMPKFEPEPTYQDTYDLLWLGGSDTSERHLVITGYTPRSYPSLYVKPAPGANVYISARHKGFHW